MKTGAVITASGVPSSLPDFDPTVMIGDTSIIKKIIITLQNAGVDPITVVTGHNAQNIEKHLSKMGVVFLRNDDYQSNEMFYSVQIGIGLFEVGMQPDFCNARRCAVIYFVQFACAYGGERGSGLSGL